MSFPGGKCWFCRMGANRLPQDDGKPLCEDCRRSLVRLDEGLGSLPPMYVVMIQS